MKQKVVVTGASGHLGSVLVQNLLQHGYQVKAGVRGISNQHSWQYLGDLGAEIVRLDVLDRGSLQKAFAGAAGVFHLGAPNLIHSPDPEREIFMPIVQGTVNVVSAAIEAAVPKLIYMSSCSAIGFKAPPDRPLDERDWGSLDMPPFLAAKVIAEQRAWQLSTRSGLRLIAV